ncbi:MAG: IS66 family transposase [Bacteroidales bacterium]|nr:IS66 family transposase [Bacteroidales bacterium]
MSINSIDKDNRIAELEQEVKMLKAIIFELMERLARYENPKNSRNSSIPPSKDENRPFKSKSLREVSGKKPGGQPGHEGKTLEMVSVPDEIVVHNPLFCKHCGLDVSHLPAEMVERRQVVEIPPIKPIYIEHQVFARTCTCGHTISGSFPQEITPGISYGKSVESLSAYFYARQFLPFARMQEMFNDVFSLPISEGGIHQVLARATAKAEPAYELIHERITQASVVGSDETGTRIGKEKGWFWTWQNEKLTFITASMNRGTQTINQHFENGFPKAVLVHDCWKSHFEPIVLTHQICIAHLLRELTHLDECYDSTWPKLFKELLRDAIHLKQKLTPSDYLSPIPERTELVRCLLELIEKPISTDHKELASFHRRMVKYKNYIFTFLFNPEVPPDNNGSERAIRNIKVKHKISGYFKSFKGASQFAILRSVLDTTLKNRQNILNAFTQIISVPSMG